MRQTSLVIIVLFLFSCCKEKVCQIKLLRISDQFPCVPVSTTKDSIGGDRTIHIWFRITNPTDENLTVKIDIDALYNGKRTRLHSWYGQSHYMHPNDTAVSELWFKKNNFEELGIDDGTISPLDLISLLTFERHKPLSNNDSDHDGTDIEFITPSFVYIFTNRCDDMHCK